MPRPPPAVSTCNERRALARGLRPGGRAWSSPEPPDVSDCGGFAPGGFESLSKEDQMFRNAMYVRFCLLMLLLVAVAVFLGSEPWGPT